MEAKNKTIDRVAEWGKFSDHMIKYIEENTLEKYKTDDGNKFMTIADKDYCIQNIIKYAIRLKNGKGKDLDLEKIAHYSCFAWSE